MGGWEAPLSRGNGPQKLAAHARERRRRRHGRFAGAVHDANGLAGRGGIARGTAEIIGLKLGGRNLKLGG